jgi:hypothetical protein
VPEPIEDLEIIGSVELPQLVKSVAASASTMRGKFLKIMRSGNGFESMQLS